MTAMVMMALLVPGCGRAADPVATVSGVVVAGPVCPVETDPPDLDCAPRPVAGAQIRFEAAAGDAVVATTDRNGVFRVDVLQGSVLVAPQPVEGLLGTPQPFEVEVSEAGLDLGTIEYDTGIR